MDKWIYNKNNFIYLIILLLFKNKKMDGSINGPDPVIDFLTLIFHLNQIGCSDTIRTAITPCPRGPSTRHRLHPSTIPACQFLGQGVASLS